MRRNRVAIRCVVLVVGTIRGVGAALAAAVLVLSGCGSAEVDMTTSPPPETPVNPWDLPLEERPPLFDPCTEIPIEAVEKGVGGPVQIDETSRNHQPNELHTCAWRDDEVLYVITATWLNKQGFLDDPEFGEIDTESIMLDRPSFRMSDGSNAVGATCYQVFFTSRGAAVLNLNLMKSMGQYRGDTFVDSCDVLDESIGPIVGYLPAGDF